MFRALCTVVVSISVVSTAPQDNTDIAYAKPIEVIDEAQDISTELPQDHHTELLQELPSANSLEDTRNESTTTDVRYSNELTTIKFDTEVTAWPGVTTPVTTRTERYQARKLPSPRFLSKLSYFKNSVDSTSSLSNFIERTSKRKFRSRCRCEKISNCPKLQISVPRCPEEYFMCCF